MGYLYAQLARKDRELRVVAYDLIQAQELRLKAYTSPSNIKAYGAEFCLTAQQQFCFTA